MLNVLFTFSKGVQHFSIDVDLIAKELITDDSVTKDEPWKPLARVGRDDVQAPSIKASEAQASLEPSL